MLKFVKKVQAGTIYCCFAYSLSDHAELTKTEKNISLHSPNNF